MVYSHDLRAGERAIARQSAVTAKEQKSRQRKWIRKYEHLSKQLKLESKQLYAFLETSRLDDVKHHFVANQKSDRLDAKRLHSSRSSMERSIAQLKVLIQKVQSHLQDPSSGESSDAYVSELRKRMEIAENALETFKTTQRRRWQAHCQEELDLEEDLEMYERRIASWDMRTWSKRICDFIDTDEINDKKKRMKRHSIRKTKNNERVTGETRTTRNEHKNIFSTSEESDPIVREMRLIEAEAAEEGAYGGWLKVDHETFCQILSKNQLLHIGLGTRALQVAIESAMKTAEDGFHHNNVRGSGGGKLLSFFKQVCTQVPAQSLYTVRDHYIFYLRCLYRKERKKKLVIKWRKQRDLKKEDEKQKQVEKQKLLIDKQSKESKYEKYVKHNLEEQKRKVRQWRYERQNKQSLDRETKKSVNERIAARKAKEYIDEQNYKKALIAEYKVKRAEEIAKRLRDEEMLSRPKQLRNAIEIENRRNAVKMRTKAALERAAKEGENRRNKANQKENREAKWQEDYVNRRNAKLEKNPGFDVKRLTRGTHASQNMTLSRQYIEAKRKSVERRAGGHDSSLYIQPSVAIGRTSGVAIPSWREGI